MEPAIGASLPSLDDLPPGSAALASDERAVALRWPGGRRSRLAPSVEGPYRLLAAGLSDELCDALDDCETYEATRVLAEALGDRRPQPEGSTALWRAVYAQALGSLESRPALEIAGALGAQIAAEKATLCVEHLRRALPYLKGEALEAARDALGLPAEARP